MIGFKLFIFTVPESPQKLKITVKTDSSVIISWLPPPQRNFVPITGYTLHIRHKHDAAEEISTDQVQIEASDRNLHYIAEGLKSSVYYQFWVVANSLLGQGNASIIQGYRVARSKHNIGTNTKKKYFLFCLKITQNVAFEFFNFGILRKLQCFKRSPKCRI